MAAQPGQVNPNGNLLNVVIYPDEVFDAFVLGIIHASSLKTIEKLVGGPSSLHLPIVIPGLDRFHRYVYKGLRGDFHDRTLRDKEISILIGGVLGLTAAKFTFYLLKI